MKSKKQLKTGYKPKSNLKKKNLLTLKHLSFSYGERIILKDICLDIVSKSFTSIIGESGSGKSTLLYILAGLLKPDAGEYVFQEQPLQNMGKFSAAQFRRTNIGVLFQDFRLLPFLTAKQNIKLPLYFLPEKIQNTKVENMLDELKISHRQKAYPRDLSGGEAQRTAMARAMVLEPKLLLLDEPTGNLDFDTEKSIVQYLRKFRKQRGLSIICITHSKYITAESDEVWTLKKGVLSK